MRKVLFLDRDGVINKDVSYLYKIADLQWVDGAKEALKLAHDSGYSRNKPKWCGTRLL